jgi:hypothetical protein
MGNNSQNIRENKMYKFILVQTLLITSILLPQNLQDQNYPASKSKYFEGKNGIDLNIGFYDNTTITSLTTETVNTSTSVSNESGGFIGSISYQYWFKNYLSFRIGAGALVTNVETQVTTFIGPTSNEEVTSEVATVVPILAGLNFYPLQITDESRVLPYISLYAGPYIGVYTKSAVEINTVTEETTVETVIGSKVVAGFDLLVGSIFKLGLNAGYHFVGDFSKPIGSETNYSGPEYSLTFGFVF